MAIKKIEIMRRFARNYREQKGQDAPMYEVAQAWQAAKGKMPKARTSLEMLAKEFSKVAAKELFYDNVLNEPYNASICYPKKVGDKVEMYWTDTDKASREKVVSNVIAVKRNGAVGILTQATKTVMHWNRTHPDEEAVQLELDLGPD